MRATIETPRLKLRPLALADAPAIARYSSDPAVARMTDAIPSPNPICAVEGWMLILAARAPLGLDHVYAIEMGRELAGVISASESGGDFSLGYWLGRPFWGQGLATEAARAVAVEARAYGPVVACHYTDNPASGRVLEKAGFVYTGAICPRFSLARGALVEARHMRLDAQRMAA